MNVPVTVSAKWATNILLGVNFVLLCASAMTLMFILLEDSTEMYARAYYATSTIQPIIIYSWFLSLMISPALAISLSLYFGYEVRKTIQWKISIAIMVFAGLPSIALIGLGFAMHGI